MKLTYNSHQTHKMDQDCITTDSCAPDGGRSTAEERMHEQSMNHICTLTSSVCVISRGTKFESTKPPHLVVKRLHSPMPAL